MGNRSSRSSHEDDDQEARMSYWQMAKMGYQELVNAIIRPPRANYDLEHLGPQEFIFGGKQFARIDYDLQNERGMKICCSHWQPVERVVSQLPCVIYMHGNSSARVEAIPQLTVVLSLGCTLLSFDFTGSGRSDGDYVSLGYYEREDLKVVIEHLRQSGSVSYVALWGRSMGAATSLLHGDRDPSIAAMVLDSPFADLTQLAAEMVDKGREAGLTVPNWVVKAAIRMIRNSVKQTAGFDIRHLTPIAHADSTFIPALFVAGENDDFIHPHHSRQIYEKYGGDKNLILVEGDHNSPRPKFLFDSVGIFLQNYLQIPIDWALNINANYMGLPPWYIGARGGASDPYIDALNHMMTLSGDPNLDVGMTQERQQNIQNSVQTMLGDRNAGANANSRSAAQSHNSLQRPSTPHGGSSGNTPAPVHRNEPDDGIRIRTEDDEEYPYVAETVEDEFQEPPGGSWTCGLCTLVNDELATHCRGCTVSYQIAGDSTRAELHKADLIREQHALHNHLRGDSRDSGASAPSRSNTQLNGHADSSLDGSTASSRRSQAK